MAKGNGSNNGKPKISGLVFSELIKRGYSLDGKTRVWDIADSKLWYLTPVQSQSYLDLEQSGKYQKAVNKKQSDELLSKNATLILEMLEKTDSINVIDLGCGDGTKAANFIKKLSGKVKVRYCPIDISGYMVQKAIETFSKLDVHEIVEFQYNISDFENLSNITPLLTKGEFKRNLFLLLGNTLGNFEIHSLLYEIRNAMKEGDLLLVDTAIPDENIKEKAESHAKNELAKKWMLYIPNQLGLEESDLEFGSRFKNSRVELYFTLLKDKEVVFQGKKVTFNEGDQILVLINYKHQEEDLQSYFKMYFSESNMILSPDKSQIFVLCKK